MPAIGPARNGIQRRGARSARDLRAQLATDVRRAREDAGLSQRSLAQAAGVSSSSVHRLELGEHDASMEMLARVSVVLGLSLSIRLYPGTGPLVRDHIQVAMIEALMKVLHERWRPRVEVAVNRPSRGVIDLVLESDEPPIVACEAHSELRRVEQQIRWADAKASALEGLRETPTSRLLLLRSTRRTRAVVSEYRHVVMTAYPARTTDLVDSLLRGQSWPGHGLLWCSVEDDGTRILGRPPRGVTVGR